MKVLFAGPSLHGLDLDFGDVVRRGPAEMGDIEAAVAEGATAIGLVDGHYGQVGAVWHKEILLALSEGAAVLGAASMGALRAAECAAFGMIPVGEIARRYCSGDLFDDADVALTNLPGEFGYAPVTIAMVDVEATAQALLREGQINDAEAGRIIATARGIYFQDREPEVLDAALRSGHGADIAERFRANRRSQKADDARQLLEALRALPDRRGPAPTWQLQRSAFWQQRPDAAAPSESRPSHG